MTGELYRGVYTGRRVMVTGHTGFLGTWAVRWLGMLGAETAGYSRGRRDPGMPNGGELRAFQGDISDAGAVDEARRDLPEPGHQLRGRRLHAGSLPKFGCKVNGFPRPSTLIYSGDRLARLWLRQFAQRP